MIPLKSNNIPTSYQRSVC